MRHCRRPQRRGIAIAVSLLVLMIISVIGLAIASIGTQDLNLATADRNYGVCRYGAEAGIADSVSQLLNDPAWSAGFSSRALSNLPGVSLTYSVAVTNNYAAASGNRTAGDGTIVPPGTVYLFSTGRMNGTVYSKSVGALYWVIPNPVFKFAAFGGNAVTLGGTSSISDAFNSAAGPYSNTNRLNTNCDVATNGTTNGAITYSGGASNKGTAYGGYGSNPSQVVNGQVGTNCDAVAALSGPVFVPTPVCPLIASTQDYPVGSGNTINMVPGMYQDFNTATHTTVNFAAGIYFFRNVEFGSQNTINLPSSGKVTIYVSGTWDSQGGTIVNPQAKPELFQIMGTATCTSVKVTGGNSAYYVVDAPTADVLVTGGADLYGAVMGKTASIQGGGAIHYDVNLRNMNGRAAMVTLKYWKRF